MSVNGVSIPRGPAPGRRLGRYHLAEPLGGGPTGEVFRAKVYGVAGFERQFAVKRFHPDLVASPDIASAIAAAARMYGGLDHPRIARLHEYGVAGGETFTATELVQGVDFGRLCAATFGSGQPLPPGAAAALLINAARAVGYAHGRGVCHLGIAPTNLIATAAGDVKVTDFGILPPRLGARPADDISLAPRICYLAPEQLVAEATSAATDVFQLGVCAYYLLTGAPAFIGPTPLDIAQHILGGVPAEPHLPRPLVKVLMRCVARSPFERYPDARALADALEAAVRAAPLAGSARDVGQLVRESLQRLAQLNETGSSGALSFSMPQPPRPGSLSGERVAAESPDDGPTSAGATVPAPAPARTLIGVGAAASRPGTENEDEPTRIRGLAGGSPPPIPVARRQPEPDTAAPGAPLVLPAPGATGNLRALDTSDHRPAPEPHGALLAGADAEVAGDLATDPPQIFAGVADDDVGAAPLIAIGRRFTRDQASTEPLAERVQMAAGSGADLADQAAAGGDLDEGVEVSPPDKQARRRDATTAQRGAPRTLWIVLGLLGCAGMGAGAYVVYRQLQDGGRGSDATGAGATAPAAAADAGAAAPVNDAGGAGSGGTGSAISGAAAIPGAAPEGGDPGAGDHLVVRSEPSGARVYIDGTAKGKTPIEIEATSDKLTLTVALPGYRLETRAIDGRGVVAIKLVEVTPFGGPGGIKVRCKVKDRYQVFVDGADTGQVCPSERIGVELGPHVVEIYDPVTDSRRQFNADVKQTNHSVRVRID